MSSLLLKFPTHLTGFLAWWAYGMPVKIFRWFEEMLSGVDANLQLWANLRLWLSFEPLFGDYGWRGRTVGFLMRGIRLGVTLIVYLIVIGLGVATLLTWLLLLPASLGLIFGLI